MSACPECGAALPSHAQRGLCPTCLLQCALDPYPEEDTTREGSAGTMRLVRADGTTAPLPFEAIGDYELFEEIGHGGMGVIFKARQRSLDRLVAVKLIRSGALASPGDVARFRTEATAAARLQHPNIVAIYEVSQDTGQNFYSMELVPGLSLAAALREGPLAPRRAATIVQTVAQAIHFAHGRGVLHRDLKPSNILLDVEDQPHVADFGLAKIVQAGSELTLTGAVLGSPHYMPPEQARGRSSEVGARSDVYSLGAILYELLTSRPPFSAATPLETMKLVVEREPIAPRALNPTLPRDLETICLKCLAKEPAARFASAQMLADELQRFLGGEPIRARPVTSLERAWRWCRRKPALASLGAVLLLAPSLIIAGLIFFSARLASERNSARHHEQIARQQQQIANRHRYAADITLALNALDADDYGLSSTRLSAQRSSRDNSSEDLRGFEWRWLWERARGQGRQTPISHLAPVKTVCCSPDGRFVASASFDGTTRLWDALSQTCLRTLSEPGTPELRAYTDLMQEFSGPFPMFSTSFSADSRSILTACHQALTLWDVESGRRLLSLQTNLFFMALFSPTDANSALVTRRFTYTADTLSRASYGLFDAALGTITEFTNGRADAVCFTPNGRQFARWDRSTHRVTLQNLPTGEEVASFVTTNIPDFYIEQMVVTPDGRTLAACNLHHGRLQLFELPLLRHLSELQGHTARVAAIAASPDNQWLASGSYDQTIRLWDLAARRDTRKLLGHRGAVTALAFSPDSRRLVSGGHDGAVRFWDLHSVASSFDLAEVFGEFAFSFDGQWMVTQDSRHNRVTLWQLPALREERHWEAMPFQSAVLTADRLLMARTGSSGRPPEIQALSVGPSGQPNPQQRHRVATNSLCGIQADCSAIAFSPDGQFAITWHRDGTVCCWETSSAALLQRVAGQLMPETSSGKGRTYALAFSADGRTAVMANSLTFQLSIWAVPELRLISTHHGSAAYTAAIALSPDGRQLALGGLSQGTSISLWDTESSQPGPRLRGHRDFLRAVAYAPDGRTLASAGTDGLLKLWHLPTERELGSILALPEDRSFVQVAFSPDGTWLGASDDSGHLHLYHAPPLADLDATADAQSLGPGQ